jgi:hypothetical protein
MLGPQLRPRSFSLGFPRVSRFRSVRPPQSVSFCLSLLPASPSWPLSFCLSPRAVRAPAGVRSQLSFVTLCHHFCGLSPLAWGGGVFLLDPQHPALCLTRGVTRLPLPVQSTGSCGHVPGPFLHWAPQSDRVQSCLELPELTGGTPRPRCPRSNTSQPPPCRATAVPSLGLSFPLLRAAGHLGEGPQPRPFPSPSGVE